MLNLINFLQYFDYLSPEVRLTFHKTNETRLKTSIGGLISFLSIACLIGICLYFFINLIEKGTIFVTFSSDKTPFVNLSDSNGYPILLRLSDSNSQPFNSPESIYSINLKYWFGGSNDTINQLEQTAKDIEVERCSLEKHFGDYKHLFNNLSDLNTFFCPKLRSFNETLYGRYGDVYPFSFYQFYIKMCINKTECKPFKEVLYLTENCYLDFRTVDNAIKNYDSQPKAEIIKSDRYMISNTVYKRIWIYFDYIKYITDEGLFFPSETITYFSQYQSALYDSDHRDMLSGVNSGTFAAITFLNSGSILTYNRRYLKVQDYLASIGGITKFIEICAFILNYVYSQNTYYLKMINDLSLMNTLNVRKEKSAASKRAKTTKIQINHLTHEPKIDLNETKERLENQNIKTNYNIINKMKKPCYRVIPLFCLRKQDYKIFQKFVEKVKEMLNISSILLNIENHQNYLKSLSSGNNAPDILFGRNQLKKIDNNFKNIINKEFD